MITYFGNCVLYAFHFSLYGTKMIFPTVTFCQMLLLLTLAPGSFVVSCIHYTMNLNHAEMEKKGWLK